MIVRVLIVSICLGFLSCQGNATPPRGIKIAALLKTSTNPFFQLMWEGIKQEADLIGVKVDLFWPESESDFAYQYNFLQSKAFDYDALIIAPSNAEGVRDYLPPLRAAGKWIILTDIDFPLLPAMKQLDYYDAFIGTDDAIGAKLVAEFVKKRFRDLMQVTVVAGFSFLALRQVILELLFARECEAVDPGKHRVLFVSPPVCACDAVELE